MSRADICGIRRFVYSSPTAYRLYLRLFRKISYCYLPSKQSTVFLTAYPRSGLSFTVDWLKCWRGGQGLTSHFHTLAALKIAHQCATPTLVIFREPLEAISSCVVKTYGETQNLDQVIFWEINRYLEFYRFSLQKKDQFILWSSQDALTLPLDIAKLFLNKGWATDSRSLAEAQACIEMSQKRLRKDAIKTSEGSRPLTQVNFPNPLKEQAKSKVRERLLRLERFREAEDIFAEMGRWSGRC